MRRLQAAYGASLSTLFIPLELLKAISRKLLQSTFGEVCVVQFLPWLLWAQDEIPGNSESPKMVEVERLCRRFCSSITCCLLYRCLSRGVNMPFHLCVEAHKALRGCLHCFQWKHGSDLGGRWKQQRAALVNLHDYQPQPCVLMMLQFFSVLLQWLTMWPWEAQKPQRNMAG